MMNVRRGEVEQYHGIQRGSDETSFAAGLIVGLSAAMASAHSHDPENGERRTVPEHDLPSMLRSQYDERNQALVASVGNKRDSSGLESSRELSCKKRRVTDEPVGNVGSLQRSDELSVQASVARMPDSLPQISSEQFRMLAHQIILEQAQNQSMQSVARGQYSVPQHPPPVFFPQDLRRHRADLSQAELYALQYTQPLGFSSNPNNSFYNSRAGQWNAPTSHSYGFSFAIPESVRHNHQIISLNAPVSGGHFPPFSTAISGYNDVLRQLPLEQPTPKIVPHQGSRLPCTLAHPSDAKNLTSHQFFLRHQIEAFQATEDDTTSHVRGRNRPVRLGQVGIRCRHCAHVPSAKRQKGSTYFPASVLGLYQAAQNMSSTHLQCGLCSEMPESMRQTFAELIPSKNNSSKAGRSYWAEIAKQIGMVDTEDGTGILFVGDLPTKK